MRGKVQNDRAKRTKARITPAYAGKSKVQDRFVFIFQDHPRLCGEKSVIMFSVAICGGSPPPMRGKELSCLRQGALSRITPAYAGKRCCCAIAEALAEDHPRLCGEKVCRPHWKSGKRGSPPPMRGKAFPVVFIMSNRRDHPRLCGEKSLAAVPALFL